MTSKSETEAKAEAKDTKAADAPKYDSCTNPSGASEEQLKAGEMVGKVKGPEVDSSYHAYEFTDPQTGEPLETHQVIHDVAVGVNEDGSLKTEKGDKVFAMRRWHDEDKPKGGADTKQSEGANQGEAGEHTSKRTTK